MSPTSKKGPALQALLVEILAARRRRLRRSRHRGWSRRGRRRGRCDVHGWASLANFPRMPSEDKKQNGEHSYNAHYHPTSGIAAAIGYYRGVTVSVGSDMVLPCHFEAGVSPH